ncbi:vWA domain-containing protein [Haloarchaeobius amylolyticus]|uniref:vWA domain-containing protein n=1 Tax=Haloarchaeobius amylolyticus TaxID=1198296 RepID=UPI003F5F65CA
MIVLDRSGSMDPQGEPNKFQNAKDGAKSLVDALGPGAQVGLVSFSDQGTVDEPLGSARQDVKDSIDGLSAGGTTNIADAISDAQSELAGGSGDNQYMVVLSNGVQNTGGDARGNATAAKDAGIHIISIAYGSGADQNLMEDISSPDKVDDGTIDDADENAFVGEITDIDDVFDDIGDIIVQQTGEQVFRRGTLGSDLEALSTDDGIPLDGDLSTDYDEIGGIGNETDPELGERECFAASETHYIGFAWYLPVDHANEIQTDSVVFNLGFYTEQCRHNDGSGQSGTNLQISGKRGNGFAKVQENYNGDQTISGGARARFGGQNTWELAVGDAPGSSNFSQGEYSWTSGKTVDWMVSYDDSSDELSFTFDGNTISQTLSSEPSGRIAVQGKADEATVEIDDLSLSVDGGAPDSPVPDGVTATNDGTGREIRYLSIDPGFDGSQSFEYSGTTTVSLQGDFPGGDEDVAFDVVVE